MEISQNLVQSMVGVPVLMFLEYLLVLIAVLADLVSGVRKAKQMGLARRSKAFRRTIDKLARYYNALFALSIVDAMQLIAIAYLRAVESLDALPLFPLFTLLGAIGIALIELKSIFEKAEVKEQQQYRDAAEAIIKLLRDHDVITNLINLKSECNEK